MNTTLYAWANSLEYTFGDLDHTWVTNYSFTNGEYPNGPPAGEYYWYCWGAYHDSADHGMLGQATGDFSIASDIVIPNLAPPALPGGGANSSAQDGSIQYYGVDGVCHMVANQVLYATGDSSTVPMLVSNARGYELSSFLYTDYGLNTVKWEELVNEYAPNVKPPADYFSVWLASSDISFEDGLIIEGYRETAQLALGELRKDVPNLSVDEIFAAVGAIMLAALTAIDKLIGWDNTQKLFPSLTALPTTAEEAAFIVDRDQLETCMNRVKA